MQAGPGARATGKGKETTARLGRIRHRQGVAIRCLHVQAGSQTGKAADSPGAVQAAPQLGQTTRRLGSKIARGAGFMRLQRQTGKAAGTRLGQPLDLAAQAERIALAEIVTQLAERVASGQGSAVQQPGHGAGMQALLGEASVLFRLAQVHGPPVHPEPVARTRQRHIGQAQLFGKSFAARLLKVRLEPLAAQVEQRPAALVVAAGGVAVLAEQLAVPEEGAIDQRVLQPLAGMDGDDLHALGIAFQTQQGLLATAFAGPLRLEPGEQRLEPGAQQALGLQQLAQVQQVGQPPLAVDPGQ